MQTVSMQNLGQVLDAGSRPDSIDPKFNNVLVFDDLMSQATDSPLLSLLFTQGRHRNASVILTNLNSIHGACNCHQPAIT